MNKECPQKAALIIKGELFKCDTMSQMHESCDTHEGWPHGNAKAEAIWQ